MSTRLLLTILLTILYNGLLAETEPNNTLQQANTLAHNGSQTGTMTGSDTEDWFVINVPQGGIFTLTVIKTGAGNGTLYLYDGEKQGNPEITNIYLANGDSPGSGWALTVPLLAGRYYAKFLKYSDPVNYQVNATLVTPSYPEDSEPNDTMLTASVMPVNGTVSGILHYYKAGKGYDNRDWYKITLNSGGILKIRYFKKGGGNTTVYFRDGKKTGNNELTNFYLPNGDGPADGWTWSFPVLSGEYYFQVEGGGGELNYKFEVSLTAPSFTEDTEPNDSALKALNMPGSGWVNGNVHYYNPGKGYDLEDWYKLVLAKGGILNLKIHKRGPGNSYLRFRDGNKPGNPEITNYYFSYWETAAEGEKWSFPVLAGTYYFQVEGGGSVVDYRLEVSLTDPAFAEDKEPNDSLSKALTMPLDGSITGNLHYYKAGTGFDNADWYKLEATAGGTLSMTISKKGPGNTWLSFRDGKKAGNPELSTYYFEYWESPDGGWKWSYPILAGTYYFRIEGGGSVVDYKLDTKLDKPVFAEDTEPNDSLTIARNFALNDSVTGILGHYKPGSGTDVWDWYVINTAEYGYLSFQIEKTGSTNGNIRLRDSKSEIGTQYMGFGNLKLTYGKLVPAGKYYIGFERYDGNYQYKAKMKFIPKPKADFTWVKTDNSFAFEDKSQYPESWSWNFDDNGKSTAVNPSHEYAKPGDFNVCLAIQNVAGKDTVCKKVVLPGVSRITPAEGGNTGDVTIQVFGGGLDTLYSARIKSGSTVIAASGKTWIPGKSSINVRFDLRNKPTGTYDMVIEKQGGPVYTLPAGFRIIQGGQANPWVNVSGRNRLLFNTWTTYTVNYGNSGNVDAVAVPFYITFTKDPKLEVDFSKVYIQNPDSAFNETMYEGIYSDVDTLFGEAVPTRVYPLMFSLIPANSVSSFTIRVKTSGNLKVNAWAEQPWFQSPLNEKKAQCVANIASAAPVTPTIASKCVQDKIKGALMADAIFGDFNPANPLELNSLKSTIKIFAKLVKKCGVKTKQDKQAVIDWLIKLMIEYATEAKSNLKSALVFPDFDQCSAEFTPQNQQQMPLQAVSSLDPNEKDGPNGYGPENYISVTRNFPYTIMFENKATATAPAHIIRITDQLDKAKFDLSTFRFGNVTLGDSLVQVKPDLKEFTVDRKLDKLKVIARITGKIDTVTGNVEWKFRSLDPVTFDDVEDPDIGLLPPNTTSPRGEGNVTFFVRLKADPLHRTSVSNQASIVFDSNPAILTNRHQTTFDLVAPQSSVQSLSASTNLKQFVVKWNGSDDGSGIAGYIIYYRVNNGAYTTWLTGTTKTSTIFQSKGDYTYEFFSRAVDFTGNTEAAPLSPDATTKVVTGLPRTEFSDPGILVYPVPVTDRMTVEIRLPGRFIFSVYGIDGRLRFEKTFEGNSINTITSQGLPEGLYIWRLAKEDMSMVKTEKFSLHK